MGDFNWNGFLPEMFGLAGAGSAMNGQAQGLPGAMEALGLGSAGGAGAMNGQAQNMIAWANKQKLNAAIEARPEPEKPNKRPGVEILPPIQPRKIRFE